MMIKAVKAETSNVFHVGKKLAQSKALGRSVSRSIEGLSAEKSMLLEENLALLALRWLEYQQQEENIEESIKGVREFSALTKLLLDVAERREKRVDAQDTEANAKANTAGLSLKQITSFRDALLGD